MKNTTIILAVVLLTSCYRELHVEQSTEITNLKARTTEVEYQPIVFKRSRYEITLIRKRNRFGDTLYLAENLEIERDSNIIKKHYERIVNSRGKSVRFDYPIDLLDYMQVRDYFIEDTTHTTRGISYKFKKEYPYKSYTNY
jgi:hypothetical protein